MLTGDNKQTLLLTADWVLPITGQPLKNGVIIVEDSVIKDVLTQAEFLARCERGEYSMLRRIDYGPCIIMPGLINLHTHLEYTDLHLFDTSSGFFQWIIGLIELSHQWNAEQWRASALAGAKNILAAGTTCIADSSYNGSAAWAAAETGLRAVVGLELFGVDETKVDQIWQAWLTKRETFLEAANGKLKAALDSGRIKLTAAPHTPYTVCPQLWQRALSWSTEENLPLLAHLSESPQECQWIASDNQELSQFLKAIVKQNADSTLTWKGHGNSPPAHLAHWGLLSENSLFAHCVHLSDGDIELILNHKSKIAHCPRSNSRLRNGIAPLPQLLDAKAQIGFGTDSLASSDDLNILAEANFAWNLHRGVDPNFPGDAEQAVYMLTAGGAECLGLEEEIGSLEAGMQADIAVFSLPVSPFSGSINPYDWLIYGSPSPVAVYVAGELIE